MNHVARRPVTASCVDDSDLFRTVAGELIAATPDFTLVGEAASAEEGITGVASLRPDLVLLDVGLPGMNGFDAAAIMVEGRRDLVVILMSAGTIEPPGGYAPRGGEVAVVPKEELCPRKLLDLWHGRRTRYPSSTHEPAAHA